MLNLPSNLFHVTTADRLNSIFKEGLKIGSKNISEYEDLEGIYLTNDPQDLVSGYSCPELIENDVLIILTINIDEKIRSNSILDSEFDSSEEDPFSVICKVNILPESISFAETKIIFKKGTLGQSILWDGF